MELGDAGCGLQPPLGGRWSLSSISEALIHGGGHLSLLQVQVGTVLSPRLLRRAAVWPLFSPALVNYGLF